MLIKLGVWFIDTQTGIVSSDIKSDNGQSKRLDHTPLALLLCLLKYHSKDVTKEVMLSEVWPNKVVSEDVLSVAVSQIRKALGDNARKPEYIKTIPGIGYRLIGNVEYIEIANSSQDKQSKDRKLKFLSFMSAILLCIFIYILSFIFPDTNTSKEITSLSAKAHYQKGRYLLTTSNKQNWLEAHQIFEDTIISSPDFAPVYRELAQVKLKLFGKDNLKAFEKREELKFLLNKSLTLSPNDPNTYLLLAKIAFSVEWDFNKAHTYFSKALEIDDTNPMVHHHFSIFLMAAGKFDLALQQIEHYKSLEPSGYAITTVAWIFNMMEEYELGLVEVDKLEQLNSDDLMYLMTAQSILENTGEDKASFEKLIHIFKASHYSENEINAVTLAFENGGLPSVNLWLLEVKKEQNNIGQGIPPLSFARYAAKAGKKDLAIKYLLQAKESREANLVYFNVDPKYKLLRDTFELQHILN